MEIYLKTPLKTTDLEKLKIGDKVFILGIGTTQSQKMEMQQNYS